MAFMNIKNIDFKNIKVQKVTAVIALVFVLGFGIGYIAKIQNLLPFIKGERTTIITVKAAQDKAEKFITSLGVTDAKIDGIVGEGNLYKISLKVQGQAFTSYMTMDGKKFFVSGQDIDETLKQAAAKKNPSPSTEVSKSDKPTVELFVMSHCPYGTQIEKGIIPVVNALGDAINFDLKFVNYSMHGEKEVREEMTQTCIKNNNGDKLLSYLDCFLKDENSSQACISQVGLDANAISTCTTGLDQQYGIMASFNDKSKWVSGNYPPFDVFKADNEKYSVQGSPTLVINGTEVSASDRSSAGLLKTICSAFNKAPDVCNTTLSAEAPSAGFGTGTADGSTTNAACGQ
jgi:hypothetical protein